MALLPHQYREDRPWGGFERFTLNEQTTIKILTISPEKELSLQTHTHRAEFWKVIEGSGTAEVGDETREATVGDEIEIPIGTPHRLTAGSGGIAVLEIAIGAFDEDDETRIDDDYGRA
jgi:mannose-1-phosphate guanylyltransferase/mannose-1-phosphate guanylyltransferase/mannose-6-phosphate isomerase